MRYCKSKKTDLDKRMLKKNKQNDAKKDAKIGAKCPVVYMEINLSF